MWKAIIVDDNKNNRELVLEILRGHALCDIACDGKEAKERYDKSIGAKKPYDFMILDINMPEVDGLEVLSYIRGKEKKSGIRSGEGLAIIMATAFEEPFADAFDSGCDDYILKPIDGQRLLEKIRVKLAVQK
ncbi:MAG: response regulator [Candidatus Omnitrophica bacterium]|nr:response regulator [Candidatus Omnitrophota bacterium]